MKLLVSQKDEIFNLIQRIGYLTPSQFNLTEKKLKDGEYITELSLKESYYFFKFIPESSYQGLFFANFSPGDKSVIHNITDDLEYYSSYEYFMRFTQQKRT